MPASSPVVTEPILAHRGASACAPENTLAAVRYAAEAGARWIETDVRLTADGGLVMIHDETLDRTTNGRGYVSTHRLEEIRALDAGGWFDADYQGLRVPTLAEFLDCIIEHGLNLQLELKEMSGREEALAEAVIAELKARWPFGKLGLFLSGFSERCLKLVAAHLPGVPRCLALDYVPVDPEARAADTGASIIQVQDLFLCDRDLEAIAASPIEFGVATVNDADRARYLLSSGVQSVLTDEPALLAG